MPLWLRNGLRINARRHVWLFIRRCNSWPKPGVRQSVYSGIARAYFCITASVHPGLCTADASGSADLATTHRARRSTSRRCHRRADHVCRRGLQRHDFSRYCHLDPAVRHCGATATSVLSCWAYHAHSQQSTSMANQLYDSEQALQYAQSAPADTTLAAPATALLHQTPGASSDSHDCQASGGNFYNLP